VKDVVIKSHDRFKEIPRDVMWLNVTLHGMSELYTLIRQLEFSILKLQENLDELLGALECVLFKRGLVVNAMELHIYKAIVRVRNIVKLARCRDVAN
jgi:hypothetical protein